MSNPSLKFSIVFVVLLSACLKVEPTPGSYTSGVTTTPFPFPSPSPDSNPYINNNPSAEPLYDFGGMYSDYTPDGTAHPYTNPATGGLSCPDSTYTTSAVLGTASVDWSIYVCWRPHVAGQSEALQFGGMWGYGTAGVHYNNPVTNDVSCPTGYQYQQLLSAAGVDYPVFYCYRMPTTLTNPPVANRARYEFGGAYSLKTGNADGNGLFYTDINNHFNPTNPQLLSNTSTNFCPSGFNPSLVLSSTVDPHPLYFCYRASVVEADVDFGGMYSVGTHDSNGNLVNHPNPVFPNIYSGLSCSDYTDLSLMGDSSSLYGELHLCLRPHQTGRVPALKFGGIYGKTSSGSELHEYLNPATNAMSCPANYAAAQLVGSQGDLTNLYYCYAGVNVSLPMLDLDSFFDLGGMFSFNTNLNNINPITDNVVTENITCPSGYTETGAFGANDATPFVKYCIRQ